MGDLLARSDHVSLSCPRDTTSPGLMNAAAFAQMQRGAIFITTARDGSHDEAPLLDALRSGHLGGAEIDVPDMGTAAARPPTPQAGECRCELSDGRRHAVGKAQHGIMVRGTDRRCAPGWAPTYAQRSETVMGRPVTLTKEQTTTCP